jgi:hypothetical protein
MQHCLEASTTCSKQIHTLLPSVRLPKIAVNRSCLVPMPLLLPLHRERTLPQTTREGYSEAIVYANARSHRYHMVVDHLL